MHAIKQSCKRILDKLIAVAPGPSLRPRHRRLPNPYLSAGRVRKILGPDLAGETLWASENTRNPSSELQSIFDETPNIDKWLHYIPVYEEALRRFRQRPIIMLEIGVSCGGSLTMWRRYLHPESVLVGIDIDPTTARSDDPGNGIHVRIGDQQDTAFLAQVVREFGPFDVILDDGGHTNSQMINSFRYLFLKGLASDGVYVVEDIHSNYFTHLRDINLTFVGFAKLLIDAMHAHYQSTDGVAAFQADSGQELRMLSVPAITATLEKIEFYDSIAVFHRARGQRAFPRSEFHGSRLK